MNCKQCSYIHFSSDRFLFSGMTVLNKLTRTTYNTFSVDFSMLILRLTFGILMVPHGYAKFQGFEERQHKFMEFMGLSGPVSLALTIFAELVCAALLAAGLFTRLVCIPLIITALVIVFAAHDGDIFGDASSGFFYLIGYLVIFLVGPGRYSLDAVLSRKFN